MENSREYSEQIDRIMDNFDFHKVRKVMKMLNWKWATENGSAIPTEPDMRKRARSLLKECAAHDDGILSTGGFTVIKKEGFIELLFYVTKWLEEIPLDGED